MKEKMKFIKFYISHSIILFFVSIFSPLAVSAQTADEMAKELENLYSRGEGTALSFTLDGEKNSLTFASGSSKFRIENPTDLIISDGSTIWHYTKAKKEVVIDKAESKSGSLSNVQELIKFSSNYSGVLNNKRNMYELQLTPSKNIAKILESVGGISLLKFTFTKSSKKGIVINKITARSTKGDIAVGNIKIKSVKKLDGSLFSFTAPVGAKTIDLRD
jgi:outer membrane lipoprotein-sorting protein